MAPMGDCAGHVDSPRPGTADKPDPLPASRHAARAADADAGPRHGPNLARCYRDARHTAHRHATASRCTRSYRRWLSSSATRVLLLPRRIRQRSIGYRPWRRPVMIGICPSHRQRLSSAGQSVHFSPALTFAATSCNGARKDYIGPIQQITAPPHGDVRPGLFLSSPGHGPNGATVRTYGEEVTGSAPRTSITGPRALDACPRAQGIRWRPKRKRRADDGPHQQLAPHPQDFRQHPRNLAKCRT